MRLSKDFYNRNALSVARDLLGKVLVRRIGKVTVRYRIIETEAYCGTKDLACHSSRGRTKRTEIMFGPAGRAYVYMIYGMYHCLNIVTKEAGGAVLIRAGELVPRPKSKLKLPVESRLNGPGILCRELKIDKKLNGADLTKSKELRLEDHLAAKLLSGRVRRKKRIGVDYAGEYQDKLWRFVLD